MPWYSCFFSSSKFLSLLPGFLHETPSYPSAGLPSWSWGLSGPLCSYPLQRFCWPHVGLTTICNTSCKAFAVVILEVLGPQIRAHGTDIFLLCAGHFPCCQLLRSWLPDELWQVPPCPRGLLRSHLSDHATFAKQLNSLLDTPAACAGGLEVLRLSCAWCESGSPFSAQLAVRWGISRLYQNHVMLTPKS